MTPLEQKIEDFMNHYTLISGSDKSRFKERLKAILEEYGKQQRKLIVKYFVGDAFGGERFEKLILNVPPPETGLEESRFIDADGKVPIHKQMGILMLQVISTRNRIMNSKIYRCGWCGAPTEYTGKPLPGKLFRRVMLLVKKYGDYRTHKVNGWCCRHEFSY